MSITIIHMPRDHGMTSEGQMTDEIKKTIDRVAKAICEAEIGGSLPESMSIDDTGVKSAAHWRKLARAAIDAMRGTTA